MTETALNDRELAAAALHDFRATKRGLLRDCGKEKLTPKEVLKRLRHRYEKLMRRHLDAEGTTYGAWTEHGPKAELDEVLEAMVDPAVWDRLVETYEARFARP